jgi:hypothetical protein
MSGWGNPLYFSHLSRRYAINMSITATHWGDCLCSVYQPVGHKTRTAHNEWVDKLSMLAICNRQAQKKNKLISRETCSYKCLYSLGKRLLIPWTDLPLSSSKSGGHTTVPNGRLLLKKNCRSEAGTHHMKLNLELRRLDTSSHQRCSHPDHLRERSFDISCSSVWFGYYNRPISQLPGSAFDFAFTG